MYLSKNKSTPLARHMRSARKTIIVITAVTIMLVITAGVFTQTFLNLALRDVFFTAFAPSKRELLAEAENLKRSYPAVVKGNWEPSPFHMNKILRKESGNLKNIGVNTVSVVPNYGYKNGVPRMSEPKEAILRQIVDAKKLGFAILLSPDFVGGDEDYAYAQRSQLLEDATKIAVEWAAVAEEFQVEFFAPQNEFDLVIRRTFQLDPARHDEAISINNIWHKDILPQIRAVYRGKIIFKAGSVSILHDASRYDYFGQDFSHEGKPPDQFREYVGTLYSLAAEVAKKSRTAWLVAEVGMPYSGSWASGQNKKMLDELQNDYFRIATEEYLALDDEVKPSGFIFIAYLMPGMDIKDRPAEAVIRLFFSKI